MKNEEDEAFDELAKRQGAWGGGFPAKRKMVMDKVHAEFYEKYVRRRTAPRPAQEPVGFMNAGHVYELQQKRITYGYVYPKKEIGASVAVYTTPPQREWVGLTDQESIDIIAKDNNYKYPIQLLQAVMDALKAKNT